jgi:hypothetical protein
MKRSLLFSLTALVLFAGCGKQGGRTLTSATGSIYECLVVIPNATLTAEQLEQISQAQLQPNDGSSYAEDVTTLYDVVRVVLGADMPCMPQKEAYFKLMQVTPALFDNMLKPTRNILRVDIDGTRYTQVKVKPQREVWSTPQAVYSIQAPSADAFLSYWLEHGVQVRDWFVSQEMIRQLRFYRASTEKNIRALLNSRFACDMLVPNDYMLLMDTTLEATSTFGLTANTHVLWACNNKGPMRRDVIVYSYPYSSQEQFTNDSIIAMRNAVLGQLVSAQVPGSHMGTEYKHFPPVTHSVPALRDSLGGFYAMETRGLWKILDGEAMGGPFVSLTRLDQVNGRIVTAEAFLFAAGQKKRNAMRQVEAILYSLEMPNERQRVKP